MTTFTEIRHVQPHSIVRLPDGRLGVAPNRPGRAGYCVQLSSELGKTLPGTTRVEVVELAVAIAHRRLEELNSQATQP